MKKESTVRSCKEGGRRTAYTVHGRQESGTKASQLLLFFFDDGTHPGDSGDESTRGRSRAPRPGVP